ALTQSGTVELGGQQSLKSPGDVTVEQVLVKVGDRVRFGQKLLILRNPEGQTNLANQGLEIRKQELKLARSRQKVEEATEKLAAIQKEIREPVNQQLLIRKQEIIVARSHQKVEEARETLTAAQQKLQQLEVLNVKGFIPGNELQDQKDQVRTAQANLRDAQSDVSTDTIELQRLQLEEKQPSQLEDKVMEAQSELREARSEVNTDSRELQRLQVEQKNIQEQLQNNVVTSPLPGMVLDLKVKDRDGVKAGDVLLTLGNPAQELVKLNLSTVDATKVKVNQKARVKIIGSDPKSFYGRVKSLYPQAIASDNKEDLSGRQSSSQAKVPATIELDRPSRTLIPGSQVSVEIILDERQNVAALNLMAVQRSRSESFVWIQDDRGRAQRRTITPGLEGVTTAEIKSGLQPGDRVILPPPKTPLQPGIPVAPATH
ncbi:MAG TPA: HlyD family efflux transporter periplasmic adaptor subunit, partial [Chroococcales cyanobacterium]